MRSICGEIDFDNFSHSLISQRNEANGAAMESDLINVLAIELAKVRRERDEAIKALREIAATLPDYMPDFIVAGMIETAERVIHQAEFRGDHAV